MPDVPLGGWWGLCPWRRPLVALVARPGRGSRLPCRGVHTRAWAMLVGRLRRTQPACACPAARFAAPQGEWLRGYQAMEERPQQMPPGTGGHDGGIVEQEAGRGCRGSRHGRGGPSVHAGTPRLGVPPPVSQRCAKPAASRPATASCLTARAAHSPGLCWSARLRCR